ncbi:NUDIX domain-containing protein [Erythrobacter litoralis]|nr:NUDIX domain-containing protein [Erythrobacter litoralis]
MPWPSPLAKARLRSKTWPMSSPDTSGAPREGIPAATIIIFRNSPSGGPPEVLMTVRSRNMTFAGGMAVFPGGRVDPADYELGEKVSRAAHGAIAPDEAAHQIAAVRETLEETGLALGLAGDITAQSAAEARAMLMREGALAPVLDAFGWSLDLDQITPFARWFPKNEKIVRAYDTRFYLADLGTGAVDVSIDQAENTHLFWTSAQGALEAAEAGEIKIIFPTRRNLERLALFASFAEARAQAEAIPVRTIMPRIEQRGGRTMLTILEDAGYPVTAEVLDDVARG